MWIPLFSICETDVRLDIRRTVPEEITERSYGNRIMYIIPAYVRGNRRFCMCIICAKSASHLYDIIFAGQGSDRESRSGTLVCRDV